MMKRIKKNLPSVIMLLLCIPLGIIFSREIANLYELTSNKGIYALTIASVAAIISFYLSIITHEGGHLIFGLISGYSFSSFRIASLMIIKQDGKFQFKRFSLAGTGGQCLMCPPEIKEGKYPVILYNLGGVIVNIVFAALAFVLYYTLNYIPFVSITLLFIAIFSAYFAISNGIPLSAGGISNDGMNAFYLSKDKSTSKIFHNQLLMNEAQSRGIRISEMPKEWFEIPEGSDRNNVHVASAAVFKANLPLDRGDTLTAETEISELLNSDYNIIGIHRALLTCDLISCRLINSPEADVSPLLTADVKKVMSSMRSFPSVIRTEYILSLLQEKNEKKAEEIMSKYGKNTKNYPYRQDVENERSIMLKALEKSKNKV